LGALPPDVSASFCGTTSLAGSALNDVTAGFGAVLKAAVAGAVSFFINPKSNLNPAFPVAEAKATGGVLVGVVDANTLEDFGVWVVVRDVLGLEKKLEVRPAAGGFGS
jgi:hypothetical protein